MVDARTTNSRPDPFLTALAVLMQKHNAEFWGYENFDSGIDFMGEDGTMRRWETFEYKVGFKADDLPVPNTNLTMPVVIP